MSKKLAGQQTEWDLHENLVVVPLEFLEEINPETFGLDVIQATEMTNGLSTTLSEREILKDAYFDIINLPIDAESIPIFKELRLKIVKNRTQGIEKWHKSNKEFYLAGGRFVDAIKNKEILVNSEMESKLLIAEKHFENLEKEKARLLNSERIEIIRPFVEDISGLDFSDFSNEDFDDFVLGKKTRFEAKIEAEKQEAIRIENERLAQIEAQRLAEIENEKIRFENSRLKKETEALQAERKLQAEKDAKIKAELQAKKDAEIEAENERLENLKAPVKKQLEIWVESFDLPMNSLDNETSKEIKEKFEAFKKWSINQINQL